MSRRKSDWTIKYEKEPEEDENEQPFIFNIIEEENEGEYEPPIDYNQQIRRNSKAVLDGHISHRLEGRRKSEVVQEKGAESKELPVQPSSAGRRRSLIPGIIKDTLGAADSSKRTSIKIIESEGSKAKEPETSVNAAPSNRRKSVFPGTFNESEPSEDVAVPSARKISRSSSVKQEISQTSDRDDSNRPSNASRRMSVALFPRIDRTDLDVVVNDEPLPLPPIMERESSIVEKGVHKRMSSNSRHEEIAPTSTLTAKAPSLKIEPTSAAVKPLLINPTVPQVKDKPRDTLEDPVAVDTEVFHHVSNFSKASTGRIPQKKPVKVKNNDQSGVMLVGHKLETVVRKKTAPVPKKPKQQVVEKSKTPEPVKPVMFDEPEELETAEEQVQASHVIESVKEEEEPNEEGPVDTGFYRDVKDVDAVVSHYAKLLENRRKRIILGFVDNNPIKEFEEVPEFLASSSGPEKPPTESESGGTAEKSLPSTEEATSSIKEATVTNSTAERPSTSATNAESSYESFCTCTCTTRSCSVCVSRATSALQSRARTKSADYRPKSLQRPRTKKRKEKPKPSVNFKKYQIFDPLDIPVLVDDEVKIEPKSDTESAPDEIEQPKTKRKLRINGTTFKKVDLIIPTFSKTETAQSHVPPVPATKSKEPEKKNTKAWAENFDLILNSLPNLAVERVKPSLVPKPKDIVKMKLGDSINTTIIENYLKGTKGKEDPKMPPPELRIVSQNRLMQVENSLDMNVVDLIEQYKHKDSNATATKLNASVHSIPKVSSQKIEPESDDDGYETEEIVVAKPIVTKGTELWEVFKKNFRKKLLIKTLKPKPAPEDKPPEQVIPAPEADHAEDTYEDPKHYYFTQRRKFDLEKYAHLYSGKKINPETLELELETCVKPIIGISPELHRKKILVEDDAESIHRFNVRYGLEINGYTSSGGPNLFQCVHGLPKRLAGLSYADRCKYPTFEDVGPPLDATGTPVLGVVTAVPDMNELKAEEKELDLQIAESAVPNPTLHRKRGILYARMEKFARAMEDLDISIKYDPFNSDSYWHRHQLYLRFNDGDAALSDLEKITDNNKVHLGAFQAKARIYQAIGVYKLAIVNYSIVIRLKSDNADAYFNRACLFELEDEIVFANEDFRAVRMLDPKNDQAIHNLAMYSFQRQLWSDCIKEFTKLILFNPEDAEAYMYRGRSNAALSFFTEAYEKDLTRSIRLCPDNASYFFHRGCLLREQSHMKAIEDLSMSILLEDSPQAADAYFHRALLYQKMNQHDLAIFDYQNSIQLNPLKAKAYLNLGILYMRYSKNYEEALTHLNNAIICEPINLRGYISRGELYEAMYRETMFNATNADGKRAMIRKKKLDNASKCATLATEDFSRAIHIRPSNYLLYLYRGRMLLKQGKVDEATFDFHAAFDLNKGIAQTFIQRTLILSFQRKYKLIIEEYDARKKRFNLVTDEPALLLLVAKARIRDGDFEGALRDLNIAGEQSRDDPQISLQKGICYEYLRNWRDASNEFSRCLVQMPTYSKAYYHRGICKLAEGDQEGEADLDKAIQLEPNFFDAFISRAGLYVSRSEYAKAINDCDEALKIEPLSIRAHILRGFCKTQLKEYAAGSFDFSKAIAIDKNSHFAFFNRAIAYQASKDYLNALKDYSIVLLINENKSAYKNRALIYWELGDNINALGDFYEAKRIAPNDAKIRTYLALALHKLERHVESCEEYTAALELDSNMSEALLGRGNVWAQIGKLVAARKDYARVLHLNPCNADTLVNIAYTMQTEGKSKEAWKYFTMAYTVDPKCTAALEGRALVNSSMNNPFAAFLDISKAIEIMPNNANLLNNRGTIYEALGDSSSALQSYKSAYKLDENFGMAYFNAANLYLKQHMWEKAVEFYTKAIQLNSNDEAAYLNRGIAYMMLQENRLSKQDFERAIQLNSSLPAAYCNLGYLYHSTGYGY